jgi:hypothetical protein
LPAYYTPLQLKSMLQVVFHQKLTISFCNKYHVKKSVISSRPKSCYIFTDQF